MSIAVHLLPDFVPAERLAGRTVVVIDVLRATTTIAHALAAGAREVIPCVEVEEARRIASTMPRSEYLLGGERGGVRIDGFDLSNSPAEYTRDVVGGKTIFFTTTNGTRALGHARQGGEILLGSFANLSALCRRLKVSADVDIICAGTRGQVSLDDVLVAGAIVDRLGVDEPPVVPADDQTTLARRLWLAASDGGKDVKRLVAWLAESWGGQHLMELGFAGDLEIAAHVDSLAVVPVYDATANRIV